MHLPLLCLYASAVRKNVLQEQSQGSKETKASDKRKPGGIPLVGHTRWGSRGKTVGAFLDHFNAAHSGLIEIQLGTS